MIAIKCELRHDNLVCDVVNVLFIVPRADLKLCPQTQWNTRAPLVERASIFSNKMLREVHPPLLLLEGTLESLAMEDHEWSVLV